MPTPCLDIARVLPVALACSPNQAAQVVRRLLPADRARLRAAAVCLSRCGLPVGVAALVLARCV